MLRLYYSFAGSIYEVSKYSICLLVGFLIFGTIFACIIVILYIMKMCQTIICLINTTICILLAIFAGVYLTSLFIYKLYQVHKLTSINIQKTNNNNNNNKTDTYFISVITKTTTLTIISMIASLIAGIIYAMAFQFDVTGNNPIWIIFFVCLFLDNFTNFFCIILTNNFAEKYYLKLCGCIDNQCHKRIFKLVEKHLINQLSPSKPNSEGCTTV